MDGQILALPDPIKYVSTRPSMNPSYSRALDAEYRKAIYLSDFSHNVNVTSTGSINTNVATPRHRLDLDVNQLQFEYHRLFSTEHVLAYRLRAMIQHFKLSEEQNLIEIYHEKVANKFKNQILKTFKNGINQ